MLDVAQAITSANRDATQLRRPHRLWVAAGAASLLLLLLPVVFRLNGRPHADWQQFLGRFHPLIVHLPIGLIVLVPLLEIGGRFRPALREAAGFVLPLAAMACVGAVCLGYLLAYGEGASGAVLTRHMWGGIALTIGTFLCCLLRPFWTSPGASRGWHLAYPAALTVVLALLSWAAHQGGSLTHGDNYLLEYLPAGVKRFLPPATPKPQAAIAPTSFYARHIHPVLDSKCAACHGESSLKGGLRVDTYELLLKGGQEGAVIVAGQPEKSLLLERVLLPSDHKKFMPAEGRTPLKPEEILWLKTWIAQGASPTATTLAGLAIAEPAEEASPPPVGDYHGMLSAMADTAASAGVKLMPVSRNPADGLILNAVDSSAGFTDARLASFLPYAPYIVEVEMGRTAVDDACFATLARFPHLRAIHLEETAVTGEGIQALGQLPELGYLNLTGTRITAPAAQALASSKTLRHLYLYNTPAQPAASAPPDGIRPDKPTLRRST